MRYCEWKSKCTIYHLVARRFAGATGSFLLLNKSKQAPTTRHKHTWNVYMLCHCEFIWQQGNGSSIAHGYKFNFIFVFCFCLPFKILLLVRFVQSSWNVVRWFFHHFTYSAELSIILLFVFFCQPFRWNLFPWHIVYFQFRHLTEQFDFTSIERS